MPKKAAFVAALLVFAVLAFADSVGASAGGRQTIYFGAFAGYSHPVEPVEELSREEAISRSAHCVGYFDDDGRLYRFEKFIREKLFFRYDYTYDKDDNLIKLRITNVEGKESVHYFVDETDKTPTKF